MKTESARAEGELGHLGTEERYLDAGGLLGVGRCAGENLGTLGGLIGAQLFLQDGARLLYGLGCDSFGDKHQLENLLVLVYQQLHCVQ